MADYGLLTDGFAPKTLPVIHEGLQAAVRAVYGASFNVGDRSIAGQFIGILAEALALVWEMGEAVNSSQDSDKATGAGLDAICALTGTFREAASFSIVSLTLTGTNTTNVPQLSQTRTASTQDVFETLASATIALATAWAATTAYVVGDRRRNGVTQRIYRCITAGTSAGSGGPTTTAFDITDGTVHWRYLGDGEGYIDVDALATKTGPIVAISGDIIQIVSAISGWAGVINILDATPGRDEATDAELRVARETELAGAGTSPADAIRADIVKLDGVTTTRVFVNNTDSTDADGMPPHSVEVLVQGGTSQDIFDQLFNSVAAGIATYGNQTGTVTDSQGSSHTVKFSRPVEVPIYADVFVTKESATYEGDTAVKTAIAELDEGDDAVGRDAVSSRISAAVFADVTGVLDVTLVEIGTAPNPTTSTTIAISTRQLATYDTSRVTVTAVNGTP